MAETNPSFEGGIFSVLKEAVDGNQLLKNETRSKTSQALIYQGCIYSSMGLLLLFLPAVFNIVMLYPEPFTAGETLLYRVTGIFTVGIGYYYIQGGRMNRHFWAVATILARMTVVPPVCATLWLYYGGPAPLCIGFAMLDPSLATWTFMTLKTEEKFTSIPEVFIEAMTGEKLLPKFGTISTVSKILTVQAICSLATGSILFFEPETFNKIMMYPEPFTAEQIPLYRTIGFCVIAIGLFNLQNSRIGNKFWAASSIAFRMSLAPGLAFYVWKVYGGPPQLCLGLVIIDLVFSLLAYLFFKESKKSKTG